MIVDASALIAVVLKEPEWESFEAALVNSAENLMSPVNRMEVFMRLEMIGGEWLTQKFDTMAAILGLKTEPIDDFQLGLAQTAFRRFGKGRHKAVLNMGDCFAYALARSKGQAILFKGNDFGLTDLESAL